MPADMVNLSGTGLGNADCVAGSAEWPSGPGLPRPLRKSVCFCRFLALLTLTFILLRTDLPPAVQYLSSLSRTRAHVCLCPF